MSAKDFRHFYDDSCRQLSLLLLSPSEIGSAVSDVSCLNTSPRGEVRSWFLATQKRAKRADSRRDLARCFKSARAEGMDLVGVQFKSRRIRIYPTKEQRNLLRRWFGVQRLVYNKAIERYNDKEFEIRNWMKLSKHLLTELDNDYVKSVPRQIKDKAVKDAYISWSANCKKTKKSGRPFSLRFKSRKDKVQSCYIPKTAVSELGIYPTKSGRMRFAQADWFTDA